MGNMYGKHHERVTKWAYIRAAKDIHPIRTAHSSDLAEAERLPVEPLLSERLTRGQSRIYSNRELPNAVLYVRRERVKWRPLSHDLDLPEEPRNVPNLQRFPARHSFLL
jgi:hypothetical protein